MGSFQKDLISFPIRVVLLRQTRWPMHAIIGKFSTAMRIPVNQNVNFVARN